MGYSHYTGYQKRSFTVSEWKSIVTATKEVIKLLPGLIMGFDGTGKPIANAKEIRFNGNAIDDQGHETFCITKAKDPEFNFCKTASKPYDVVVVAVLCIVNHFAPDVFQIGSDGNANDWAAGHELAQRIIPEVKIPPGIGS